eukprot:CAMPEP_0113307436 /NCGR_PEP_ID=MMETSP0010_2-20120614/6281_1 /TAXON_ID=216773 ORGANISM="Corethron hystrix, Strain 308" /NCGR_SAMPLE_ID=MMETSP0010_2 /ASSEMBLY_ACC=CAM_ASM_000155 /LENGTH=135 /DNA_ID=CAMNT_0000162289 /DNA_START=44 /DNA_END=451 /DNA_ORIENTATION=+ /assembly_acc=CAM_ASM_000155
MSPNPAVATFRSIHRLIRRLPSPKDRADALRDLRAGYRTHLDVAPAERDSLLLEAEKKMAYLRMITPKDRTRDGPQQGSVRYVYAREGEGGNGTVRRAPVSNWHGSNLDPESVKRHHQLLRRGGWRDNAHAKGIF